MRPSADSEIRESFCQRQRDLIASLRNCCQSRGGGGLDGASEGLPHQIQSYCLWQVPLAENLPGAIKLQVADFAIIHQTYTMVAPHGFIGTPIVTR